MQRAARQIEAERAAAEVKARAAQEAVSAGEEVKESCSEVAALEQTPSTNDNANTEVKGAVARAGADTHKVVQDVMRVRGVHGHVGASRVLRSFGLESKTNAAPTSMLEGVEPSVNGAVASDMRTRASRGWRARVGEDYLWA